MSAYFSFGKLVLRDGGVIEVDSSARINDEDNGFSMSFGELFEAVSGLVPLVTRVASTVYDAGVMVKDASGRYIGDGTTAGGLIDEASGVGAPAVNGAYIGAKYWRTGVTPKVLLVWSGTAWE